MNIDSPWRTELSPNSSVCMSSIEDEQVERGYVYAAVSVGVWQAEQIFRICYLQPGLLLHLAHHALFGGLFGVGESSGQVERAFGGFSQTALNEQPSVAVEY